MSKPNIKAEMHELVDEYFNELKNRLHQEIETPIERTPLYEEFIEYITE